MRTSRAIRRVGATDLMPVYAGAECAGTGATTQGKPRSARRYLHRGADKLSARPMIRYATDGDDVQGRPE
jgi:hypothetical protein